MRWCRLLIRRQEDQRIKWRKKNSTMSTLKSDLQENSSALTAHIFCTLSLRSFSNVFQCYHYLLWCKTRRRRKKDKVLQYTGIRTHTQWRTPSMPLLAQVGGWEQTARTEIRSKDLTTGTILHEMIFENRGSISDAIYLFCSVTSAYVDSSSDYKRTPLMRTAYKRFFFSSSTS